MLRALFRPVPVGHLFGIPILLVPAVLLLVGLALAAVAGRGESGAVATALGLVAILAVALIVHELAHALVARALGLRVIDITIWPLGGMARMEGLLDRPQLEAPVAAAGPCANLLLAGAAWALPGAWSVPVTWINLVLGLGNLLPAFPLDGGRLLRSWLARTAPVVDATRAAVQTSRWIALAVLVAGVAAGEILLALILSIYVAWSGQMEYLQTVMRLGALPQMRGREVYARALRALAARLRGRGARGAADGDDPTATPEARGDAPRSLDEELEDFHGSLDEFFRRRDDS